MNWVAKTANMIADDCQLGQGDRASIGLPPHWQSAAVLLGCWVAGLEVITTPASADVAFVEAGAADGRWAAPQRYALGLHPMALPMPEPPAGYLDFSAEVRSHGDHFHPLQPVSPGDPALPGYTNEQLNRLASDRAATLGISRGRVLVSGDLHPDPVEWLLAPLAASSSIVLCRHLDAEKVSERAAAERATHLLA